MITHKFDFKKSLKFILQQANLWPILQATNQHKLTMHTTTHMQVRMDQRNFTLAMVNAVLDTGTWNDRGDRLVMDQRQRDDLDQLITEKRRERKQLEKEVRDLERLRGKGRVTVVTTAGRLITVYRNIK